MLGCLASVGEILSLLGNRQGRRPGIAELLASRRAALKIRLKAPETTNAIVEIEDLMEPLRTDLIQEIGQGEAGILLAPLRRVERQYCFG